MHQWVRRRVIHSAVARRESVKMSVHFYLIFLHRDSMESWRSAVVLRHWDGNIICCSPLFCVKIEAEEHYSYGHHQDRESRDIFQSFKSLIVLCFQVNKFPYCIGRFILDFLWLLTQVERYSLPRSWLVLCQPADITVKKKMKVHGAAYEFCVIFLEINNTICEIWSVIDSETNIWNEV